MPPPAAPQPVFIEPGKGTQSAYGTSQTFCPPGMSRVHEASVQSVSARQNSKQRDEQLSVMQTRPGAQSSAWPRRPSDSIEQACITVLSVCDGATVGLLQVGVPCVFTEHLLRQLPVQPL